MRAPRPWLVVAITLPLALSALVLVGAGVLARDREALLDTFSRDRGAAIAEAARALSADMADIGEDLGLASTLLEGAESKQLAERELHAIATIKREYLVMYSRSDDGGTIRVVAFDAEPSVLAELPEEPAIAILDAANAAPGTLHVSSRIATRGTSAYYAFAWRPRAHGPAVAVVVDASIVLGRMKLQRDATSRVAIFDGDGVPSRQSDASLAGESAYFAGLVGMIRTGLSAQQMVGIDEARRLGLPASPAIAIGAPLVINQGPPWSLIVVASTTSLQTQEKTLVRRVLVGSALVLLLLLSAAAYVLHNAYRARTLRERLRMEQKLLHSEKLATAGQLAAGIAHEVGTPLNVARGRVELALSHLGTDHPEAQNHRLVIDQIDRVTRLLQQLLDYVRPTAVATRDVDLGGIIRSVSDLLSPQATKHGIELVADIEPGVPALRADSDQVQQIILNLVMNAIDASERGRKVTIRAARSESSVVLEVEDAGKGIEPAVLKQVFDPFFTTKKRGQGTGLGLWVVAQLVRAQAAEIELDSKPGAGTRARVTWEIRR